MPEKILVFDTTLRDGEQSPGAVLRPHEKLAIALALEKLGVDIIEAGFPLSSKGDFNAVESIAQKVQTATVCALARAVETDIKVAAKAIHQARFPRIHTFIATSDIHLGKQLHKGREEVLSIVAQSVHYAKSLTLDVEFSPMDATRTSVDFLAKAIDVAIRCGATTINIPDTVGYALPWEIEQLLKKLQHLVPKLSTVVISVHCHQDLGLAVANSLAGIKAGARQVECTINGIGERAGNASLEEIVMLLKVRGESLNVETTVNTEQIYNTSRLVSKLTHISVQPNKAIVGRNAFAHASGIHQDGYLKGKDTYEIMQPEQIGLKHSKIVLGARSGKHALKYRLSLLGYAITPEQLDEIYQLFLTIADQKRVVTNKDLLSIIKGNV